MTIFLLVFMDYPSGSHELSEWSTWTVWWLWKTVLLTSQNLWVVLGKLMNYLSNWIKCPWWLSASPNMLLSIGVHRLSSVVTWTSHALWTYWCLDERSLWSGGLSIRTQDMGFQLDMALCTGFLGMSVMVYWKPHHCTKTQGSVGPWSDCWSEPNLCIVKWFQDENLSGV